MPLTSPHGLPYPAPTDTPDVPRDLQLLAEAVAPYLPLVKRKQSPTSRSTTTLAVDSDLSHVLGVGYWRITAFFHYSGGGAAGAGDFRLRWTFGGTASGSRACLGPQVDTTNVLVTSMRSSQHSLLNTDVSYGTDGTLVGIATEDMFIVVTVAGLWEIQWAQGTASATATTLATGSRVIYQKVGVL